MNFNRKSFPARGVPQPFNLLAGSARQFKPVVAQLKTPVSAQSIKRPVEPPVYRPQPTPKVAQRKMATDAGNRKPPIAPPVYRPQVPKVLQTKSSSPSSPHVSQVPRRPITPPVYRPQPNKIVQPQAISSQRKSTTPPQLQNRTTPGAPVANKRVPFTPHGPARNLPERACPSRFPIQRTVRIYVKGKWEVFAKTKGAVDSHPVNEKKFEHPPEEGDFYDEVTGVHHRANAIRHRLQRARDRQLRRAKAKKRGQAFSKVDFSGMSKKNDNRLEFQTPGGVMYFGRGLYNEQPYGRLSSEDWEDDLIGINYDDIYKALDKSEQFGLIMAQVQDFLGSMDLPKESKGAPSDLMAITALSGLLSVAEPHGLRNPLGGKPERAAVRHARNLGSAKPVFNRKAGAYVPAWAVAGGAAQGGTGAWRAMVEGEQPIPFITLVMLGEMSESSDDEEIGAKRKRKGKKKKEESAEDASE